MFHSLFFLSPLEIVSLLCELPKEKGLIERMAVTHADLEPKSKTDLSSKTVVFLVITIILGLFTFILCLKAEVTRSQVTWIMNKDGKDKGDKYECAYNGNGKVPLLCSGCAFVGLAIALVMEHIYMLIAVSKSPPSLLDWDNDSSSVKSLISLAGFFYITTWICFAVAEILLLAGLSVESGHLNNWTKPRTNCYAIREGLFSAAGVFALTTVFLAAGLYLTILRAQRMSEVVATVGREVLEASNFFAFRPRSPQRHITTVARENPKTIESINL